MPSGSAPSGSAPSGSAPSGSLLLPPRLHRPLVPSPPPPLHHPSQLTSHLLSHLASSRFISLHPPHLAGQIAISAREVRHSCHPRPSQRRFGQVLQWRYSKRDPTPPTSPTTWYVRITLSTPQPADLTLGYCRAQIGPVAASSWMPLLPPSLSHVCGSVATYMRRKIPIDPDDLTSILMTSLRIPTHPPRIPTHPLVVTTQTTFPLPPFQAHLDLGPSHTRQGYGFETVQFGGPCVPPTLVVNAANANPGRASHLCQGPIRVDLAPLADPAL